MKQRVLMKNDFWRIVNEKSVFVKSFSRSSMSSIWRICSFVDTKWIVVLIARKTEILLRKSIYVYVIVSADLKQRHSIINAKQWKKHWKHDKINANRTSLLSVT
jgi:hypothetical protein